MVTDMQQLRALQLNSWQLLRLLQKQVPSFSCRSGPCDGFSGDQGYNSNGSMEKFCRLYLRAAVLHDSWISTELSRWAQDHLFGDLVAWNRKINFL